MRLLSKVTILALTAGLLPLAAQAESSSLGKREYEQNCASCHGLAGKGDGPLAGYLSVAPADLTKITERNNGVFPSTLIMEIIDGRRSVAVHGTRDMPAWGREYDKKSVEYYRDYRLPYDPETFIKARILALTEYIFELQEKK